MTPTEFEKFVVGEAQLGLDDINYSFVGLGGEAGECLEWHKKVNLRKEPGELTDQNLKHELGDLLHYMVRIAYNKGWSLEDIMQGNMDKLRARRRQ
jgi:NTP pyrophosphatase (non-canonical NTP hydrolase)